ncbi:MAG: phosphatase PAP2 family protein, partial [Raoultibacter sp.]
MELTPFASWLNTTFAGFDFAILSVLHGWAEAAGDVLTPFFRIISLFVDNGVFLLAGAALLLLFDKTRKMGLCVILAIAVGVLITNLAIKDIVMRPRPFESSIQYYDWWQFTGATMETSRSFPSGHATAAMAAMCALYFCNDKKKWWPVFIFVVLIGLSRNYLMVHYPTDVIGGIIVGTIAAACAYAIIQ